MAIAEGKKADTRIFIAEINYDALAGQFKKEIKYIPETGLAKNSRDISMLISKKFDCGTIVNEIKAADPVITEVTLFDLFESEKFGSDKKSMAFKIQMESPVADVTDEMAGEVVEKVVAHLREKFDAQMRA